MILSSFMCGQPRELSRAILHQRSVERVRPFRIQGYQGFTSSSVRDRGHANHGSFYLYDRGGEAGRSALSGCLLSERAMLLQ